MNKKSFQYFMAQGAMLKAQGARRKAHSQVASAGTLLRGKIFSQLLASGSRTQGSQSFKTIVYETITKNLISLIIVHRKPEEKKE